MPIYEYTCSGCAHVFEEWTQHHDSPETQTCPKCGAEAHRIVSQTSFLLKGRGWYATEYGTMKGHTDTGTPPSSSDASSGTPAAASSEAASSAGTSAAPAAPAAPAAATPSASGASAS